MRGLEELKDNSGPAISDGKELREPKRQCLAQSTMQGTILGKCTRYAEPSEVNGRVSGLGVAFADERGQPAVPFLYNFTNPLYGTQLSTGFLTSFFNCCNQNKC